MKIWLMHWKLRKTPPAEIEQMVHNAAKILDLEKVMTVNQVLYLVVKDNVLL